MKTALSRAIRLHSEGMNAESSTTSHFDERADFSIRLYLYHLSEITFLHETTQKALFFRTLPAFLKPFHEIPKKETVNLSIENAVLCFGVVSTNNFAVSVGAFSLTTAREILGDESHVQYNIFKR